MKIVNKSKNELPKYADDGAAGFDLRADIEIPTIINPLDRAVIPTGLFMEIPIGHVGFVCPRSGLAAKNGVTVTNAPGVVDETFRGEVKVILSNISNDEFTVMPGDRIAQMVIVPYVKVSFNTVSNVEEMSLTERGAGGFGSTGVQ